MIRRKLRSARTLSGGDWRILLQAWSMYLAIDIGLRRLPFKRVQGILARGRKGADHPDPDRVQAIIPYIARLVLMAERNHLYPMGCLRRSLVLHWLLQRRGIKTDFCIGVKHDEGEFKAHAWVEYQGAAIGEEYDVETRFAQLKTIDTAQ